MPSDAALGILLISGTHERAHYAFVLAAGAAAIGRRVTVFATNDGCHALCRDWSALAGAHVPSDHGVADFVTLRDAAIELGVRLVACDAGLKLAGITADALLAGVEVAGVATFLEATSGGQLLSL